MFGQGMKSPKIRRFGKVWVFEKRGSGDFLGSQIGESSVGLRKEENGV